MVLSLFVTIKIPNFQNLFDFYWYYPLYGIVVVYGIFKIGLKTLIMQPWLAFVGLIAGVSLISLWIHPYSYIQWLKLVIGWLFLGYSWLIIFRLQKQPNNILNTYFSIAIVAAFLTIPEQILHVLDIHITPKKGAWLGMYRCFSIANEPFPLAMLLMPCIIYYLEKGKNLFFKEKVFLFLLICGLFFTFSGGGWAVIGIYFIYSVLKKSANYNRLIRLGFLILLLLVSFFYKGTQLRISETTSIFGYFPEIPPTEILNNTNTSSRAIYLNTLVAWKQFLQNPILGGGLGSHGEAYEQYVTKPLENKNILIAHFNQADGASGAVRWFSEMGLFGVFLLGLLLRKILFENIQELKLPMLGFWFAFLIHAGNYFHNGSMMWLLNALKKKD